MIRTKSTPDRIRGGEVISEQIRLDKSWKRLPMDSVEVNRVPDGPQADGLDDARPALVDPFGRDITYLRVSVTDRCDFRCVYCMAEDMTFLPKADLLSLEELDRLCSAFVAKGVRKLRLTGGEPLVRRGIMTLVRLAVAPSRLRRARRTHADHQRLAARQICRPSLRRMACAASTSRSTRSIRPSSARSPAGAISTRCWPASMPRRPPASPVKINAVALKGVNEDEFPRLLEWAHGQRHGPDLDRGDAARATSAKAGSTSICRCRWCGRGSPSASPWSDIDYRTGGPARYVRVAETGGRLGFITPLTHNFCESCNRVRITCTGTLYMCLGQEDAADLRKPLRASEGNDLLYAAIDEAISRKPKGHDFIIDRRHKRPALARHMSVTGG